MKYIIIGGNAAGMSFAAKMRRNNQNEEIIALESGNYVSFGACGLPYYVGDEVKDANQLIARKPEDFLKQNIDLRINEKVIHIDSSSNEIVIEKENKENYKENYDRLIIASGANPIIFPGANVNNKNIFTLTKKEDGEKLKEVLKNQKNLNIGIIGTGFIGLEVMDSLYQSDNNIKLFTKDKSILFPQYNQEIVKTVMEEIKQKDNIEIEYNANIQQILETNQHKISVNLEGKSEEFDILIMAMGFRPNTNFIENIEKLANGAIKVDKYAQTSVNNIYAIGDCASVWNPLLQKPQYIPLATGANKLGRALAEYLSSGNMPYQGSLGASSLKVFDYEIGRVGLTEYQCQEDKINYKTKIVKDNDKPSYYPDSNEIIAKIIYEDKTLKILGIEICGKDNVVGRIDAMSVAIMQGMTTTDLGYQDFVYAPPFSRTWEFLNVIGNVSK